MELDPERAELVLQLLVMRDTELAFRNTAEGKLTGHKLETSLRNSGVLSVRLRQPAFAGDPVPWEVRLGFASLTDLALFLDDAPPPTKRRKGETQAEPDTDERRLDEVRQKARSALLEDLAQLQQMRGVQVVHPETNTVFRTWGLTVWLPSAHDGSAESPTH